MPKREIFDRSDFPDFYTIKSSWVGDSLVKILTYSIILIFERAKPHLVSDAHAEHTHQGLTRMLSMRTSSLHVCSAWFEGTSITYGRYKNGKLMRMLSIRISS